MKIYVRMKACPGVFAVRIHNSRGWTSQRESGEAVCTTVVCWILLSANEERTTDSHNSKGEPQET